jgi:hypothetical protein
VAQDHWHGIHDFRHDRIRRWWVYQTGDNAMKSALTLLAGFGALAAAINFNEIIRDPSTKGWGVGIGFLMFIGFGLWAIAS